MKMRTQRQELIATNWNDKKKKNWYINYVANEYKNVYFRILIYSQYKI